ncbi:MAG TPA: class I SAM-dependent methyltransferase [Candidatus Dormibacteraeota bacterium]|jgi:methyltransferase (TIGR00027 family)|nr:class I SAM-dependent methyltransferase [Candidatus Dormibacteraeota bacterium]
MRFLGWLLGRRGFAGPSRTSQAVAVTRAGMSRPHTSEGDPNAQRLLCRGMRAGRVDSMTASLTARTRFFDDRVMSAISTGVGQVVILGAGYDDRALRFRSRGVRFFEIDHPATQDDKRRRLEAIAGDAGPVLATADFRDDDVGAVLAGCGHDAHRPSLFLCEGLLVYLDRATIVRLLAALHSRAAEGSLLAASLAVHRDGLDSGAVAAAANARRRNGSSEPWVTIMPAEGQVRLLADAGWSVGEQTDAHQLDPATPSGRSLLVVARPAAVPAGA